MAGVALRPRRTTSPSQLDPADVAAALAKNSRPPARPWTKRHKTASTASHLSGVHGSRERIHALGYSPREIGRASSSTRPPSLIWSPPASRPDPAHHGDAGPPCPPPRRRRLDGRKDRRRFAPRPIEGRGVPLASSPHATPAATDRPGAAGPTPAPSARKVEGVLNRARSPRERRACPNGTGSGAMIRCLWCLSPPPTSASCPTSGSGSARRSSGLRMRIGGRSRHPRHREARRETRPSPTPMPSASAS